MSKCWLSKQAEIRSEQWEVIHQNSYPRCKITSFASQIVTQLKGLAFQLGKWFAICFKIIHFLVVANHIFRIILHLCYQCNDQFFNGTRKNLTEI